MFRRLVPAACSALITPRASHPLRPTASRMLGSTSCPSLSHCGTRSSLQPLCRPQALWQQEAARPAQHRKTPATPVSTAAFSTRQFASLQQGPAMKPLHVSSPHPKGPARPLLPLQAAGGGGAGAGGSGGNKGYSSSGGDSSSGSGGLWESYNKLLGQHPLLVKAVTTALLSAVGNLICQLVIEKKSDLDWRRFNTFTALGFVWVAPCLHFWFGALNRLVSSPGNTGALLRMGLDQLGFAPLFISSMIAILAGLEGKGLDQCLAVVRRDLPDAIRANWALWVPAQFINFRFVAPTYQVLFANMVALVWNVYFSFATRPKAA